ncbi:MAG TPA: molybdenum cofactor guanylyltransferase [Candidatus Limnocylindria bacterium]|nr:molybdenum cofactor guanylyltransferase [Candidatus Limnocylindria bacterium]
MGIDTVRSHPAARSRAIEVCILAGGLSTRMGRDKARLKLGGQTMLARIRRVVAEAFVERPPTRVRVVRKDRVRRCGPLGGVVTALRMARAPAVLFLACDMPLVSAKLLKRIMRASRRGERAVFAAQAGRVGFPFVLPVKFLPVIEEQIAARGFSLHALAERLRTHRTVMASASYELFNVNTPEDLAVAEGLLARRGRRIAPGSLSHR